MISFLKDVRVLDLSWLIPGPYLTMLLGDFGADVIKVEDVRTPDYFRTSLDARRHGGVNSAFQWINRNKRGIAVDTRDPEGLALLKSIARRCDVVVEGFRPGVADRRGYGYEAMKEVNPAVVYCSITGFGQDGPFARMATHGGAYDAVSGLATPYRLEDGSYAQWRPYPHGLTYGAWLGAMAVSAALVRAKTTGEGCYVDVSCTDATVMALAQEAIDVLNNESHWPLEPDEEVRLKYCYYETKDGRFMLLQSLEKAFWDAFCDAAGRPDLKDRGNWEGDRMDHSKVADDPGLRDELVKIFKERTQAEWTQLFLERDIAGAPFYSLEEARESELFKVRKMFVHQDTPDPAQSVDVIANATRVPGEPFEIRHPAPAHGQHTDEVLAEHGFDAEAVAGLRARKVVV